MNEQPPAGWYPDPADATRSRWWDGEQWTGTTRLRAQRRRSPVTAATGSSVTPDGRDPVEPDGVRSEAGGDAGQQVALAPDVRLSSADMWDADWSSEAESQAEGSLSSWSSDPGWGSGAERTARIAPEGRSRTDVAFADWDDIHVVSDDAPDVVGDRVDPRDEEERRRRLEYQRLQRLRASRAIRQDRIEELVVRRQPADDRPWWRKAASFLTQMFVILAVITVWTTILGFLLSEDASGDVGVAQQPAGESDAEVLAGDVEAPPDGAQSGADPTDTAEDGTETGVAVPDPAGGEAERTRSFGALPPIPIEFDGQCALEVDPLYLDDLSVWPWNFEECEYAPVDLDDTDEVWIVVVSSIDGGGSAPSSIPASRGGQQLGLLWSSHYPSLNAGWWVVFAGPFETESAAASARASVGGGAYVRRLTVDERG